MKTVEELQDENMKLREQLVKQIGNNIEMVRETQNENMKLREQLVKQIEGNIETLKEKDQLLDALIEKNKQAIKISQNIIIMIKALSEISFADGPLSLIAKEALEKISERTEVEKE
jgi:hypothetical protein